jgi:predicted DNA-binding WGR domain protein
MATRVEVIESSQWIRRRWERDQDARYYEALVHQDLWGDWVVTRSWGRRGSRLGRVVHSSCTSYVAAMDELATISKRRASHRYHVVI